MELIWQYLQSVEPEMARQSPYGQAWTRGMQALSQAQEAENTLDFSAYEEAFNAFLEALSLHPDRYEAYLGLTYWLILLGDESAALHYSRQTQELAPAVSEIQEMLTLLESSHLLNSLLHDVERLHQHAGWQPDADQAQLPLSLTTFITQSELLLRGHHQLLQLEMTQGLFQRLDQLHSRLHGLEALYQVLQGHLSLLADPELRERLQNRLDVLAYDLECLEHLEAQFDKMHAFQKDVQQLFRELTRSFIRLRVQREAALSESLNALQAFQTRLAALQLQLNAFEPEALKRQTRQLSGWEHLQQQRDQFLALLQSLKKH